jgi:hypothetical protein
MFVPPHEEEVLKRAFSHLHDSVHNVNTLFHFLKKVYPDRATIEYTILLHAILRMREIESLLHTQLDYPVFGKEIEMADMTLLKRVLKETLGVSCYGYLDPTDLCSGESKVECVNRDIHLYRISIK